ncbi:MAG: glycosyltransferase family 9 protein [Bdellovibrionales bacterium]|nr:glycosyltransferase family 9 protein [Bdellovibrionales bacterium]
MNRILVRAPNWIGDQVLAYPFYRELRLAYPEARIAVVCTSYVADIQFKGFIDEVFVLPKKHGDSILKRTLDIFKFAKHIRSRGPWDLGISLPNSFGAALLLKLAHARIRRGYETDWRGCLLTERVRWDGSSDTHRAQAYLNLLLNRPVVDVRGYWATSKESDFDAVKHWPDVKPIDPPDSPYFIVAPGATADSRRWSTAQFGELIVQIQAKHKWRAVVIGGPAEQKLAQEFEKAGVPVEDFTARGAVSSHWKLFCQAKFAITNESGLAHVASLCGAKVQIICGAADPKRTRPIGPGLVQVALNPVECWPCERNQCRWRDSRYNQCLNGIAPERVIEEMNVGFFNQL